LYVNEETGLQNFVIAVNAPGFSLKPVITAFGTHNRDQYRQANLSIDQKQLAEYQLLIVRPFKTKNEAINYFTTAITTRKLYRSLDTLSYRNFIITDANLKKLTETKRIAEYLNFFKTKYIASETVQSNQVVKQEPVYSGPYNQDVQGVQSFVLVVPKEEINPDKLVEAIRQFNKQKYSQITLSITNTMLDDFRVIIKVDGFSSKQSAMEYLRAIANDQLVYGPIQNANYRNFIITPGNETIFRQSKNIITYMEFYKLFYLK